MSLVEKAAKSHTDLSIFVAIVKILEGGCIYTASGQRMASRIIKLCEAESTRQLRIYDAAMKELHDV